MTLPFPQVTATVRYKLRTARRVAAAAAAVRRQEGSSRALRRLGEIAGQLLRWYHPARVWRRHRRNDFDRKFGVDTSGFMHPSRFATLAGEGADPHHYKAIRPEDFHAALSPLAIRHEEFEFVDYGCGKGRALLLASDYPFRRISGVEFSPELHQAAVRNIARFRGPMQRCDGIHAILGDAAAFDPPESPCVLFFYDPFGEHLMSTVLDRIGKSLAVGPRELYIVYCQPRLRDLMSRRPFLELAVAGEHFAIFRSAITHRGRRRMEG